MSKEVWVEVRVANVHRRARAFSTRALVDTGSVDSAMSAGVREFVRRKDQRRRRSGRTSLRPTSLCLMGFGFDGRARARQTHSVKALIQKQVLQ